MSCGAKINMTYTKITLDYGGNRMYTNHEMLWSLSKEYRNRRESEAVRNDKIQEATIEAPTTPRKPFMWLRKFREAFINKDQQLTQVPLRRAHQH